ncbi:inositol monophosphatase family protein [Falsiroseomonas sp. E2-1-a20]|uniref:inositol monophosphatase family protein n=1 Tax=Falsiroseomonas sp. E2-1-a20 TaxID=3239300 RepID=UPI003F2D6EDC
MDTRNLLSGVSELVMADLPSICARRFDVRWKADGSPVTSADLMVEERVRAYLAQHIADLTFIGEESFDPASFKSGRAIALLDPIDGTENFCSGLKEWGVSLGLWLDGQHQGSMLLLPELNERLMTGDKIQHIKSRITGFSSSFSEGIITQMRAVPESRILGCAVYNIYNVARGAFSRFSNPKGAYAWDLLPGLMLALEQGCEVLVDEEIFDGRFLEPHRRYRVDIRHRHDLHPG